MQGCCRSVAQTRIKVAILPRPRDCWNRQLTLVTSRRGKTHKKSVWCYPIKAKEATNFWRKRNDVTSIRQSGAELLRLKCHLATDYRWRWRGPGIAHSSSLLSLANRLEEILCRSVVICPRVCFNGRSIWMFVFISVWEISSWKTPFFVLEGVLETLSSSACVRTLLSHVIPLGNMEASSQPIKSSAILRISTMNNGLWQLVGKKDP